MIITYFRSTRYTILNTYNPCSIREQVSLTSGPISPLTFLLFRHFSTCPYLCWDNQHKQPMTYTKIIWMGNELVSLLGICVIRWRAAGTSKDTIQSFVVLWWTFITLFKRKAQIHENIFRNCWYFSSFFERGGVFSKEWSTKQSALCALQILKNWILNWIFNYLLGNVLVFGKKIDQTCVPLHVEQLSDNLGTIWGQLWSSTIC